MKKIFLSIALSFFLVGPAFAVITNSAHDFSASTASGEICVLCHTPHGADTTVSNAPLWHHEVTTQSFIPYDNTSGSQDSTPGQPNRVSKLCLSCHDNTVAIDAFGGSAGTGTDLIINYDRSGTRLAGYANIGTNLSDDHPVGISYQEAIDSGDDGLNPIATGIPSLGGTIEEQMLFGTPGKVECSSCHDVHNSYGNPSLLLIDNTGSVLCLTCHAK